MTLRLIGWLALAAVVLFGAGWFTGASGRSTIEQERRRAEDRADFAEARAFALEARTHLFQSNFGDANRSLTEALTRVERAQSRLRQAGEPARAGELEVAITELREAQRRSLALDVTAQDRTASAIRVIDGVAATLAQR
jgi:hypothetical protein